MSAVLQRTDSEARVEVRLDPRRAITPRKCYKKLKKQLKKRSRRRIIDFPIMAALIYRGYRIVVKYTVAPEEMAKMLAAFIRLFGAQQVVQFVEQNQDFLVKALEVTADVVIASIGNV